MAELGMSMEVPRMNLAEKIGSLFSRRLAEKRWIQNHAEQIQMYAKMAQTLPESERANVYAKIEHDMQEATGKQLKVNRVVGGVVLTAATFVGALIGIPRFQKWVDGWHIGSKYFGKGMAKWGEGAHDALAIKGSAAKESLRRLWEGRPKFLGGTKVSEAGAGASRVSTRK